MNYYRHGDLGITPLIEIPKTAKKILTASEFVLAEGEVTGHKHVLVADPKTHFDIYQDNLGDYILDLKGEVTLKHNEHKEIKIEKGIYIVKKEREYDYFNREIERVND